MSIPSPPDDLLDEQAYLDHVDELGLLGVRREDEDRAWALLLALLLLLGLTTVAWQAAERARARGLVGADGRLTPEARQAIRESLDVEFGDETGRAGRRVVLSADTEAQQGYGEGRVSQLGDYGDALPFWIYLTMEDDRVCPQICDPLEDVVLRAGHEFWSNHAPQMHFYCRCVLRGLSPDEAQSAGITDDKDLPKVEADDGFGDINPRSWTPQTNETPPGLWRVFADRAGLDA